MHQEIGKTIGHNAEAGCLHPPCMIKSSEINEEYAGHSEDHKEGIILFEEARLRLVMILMQVPKKPMHHEPVRTPCYTFHQDKSPGQYYYIINHIHAKSKLNDVSLRILKDFSF